MKTCETELMVLFILPHHLLPISVNGNFLSQFADSLLSVQDMSKSCCTPLYYVVNLSTSESSHHHLSLGLPAPPCFLSLLSTWEPEPFFCIITRSYYCLIKTLQIFTEIESSAFSMTAQDLHDFVISSPTTHLLTHFTLVTLTSCLFPNKCSVFLNHPGGRSSSRSRLTSQDPDAGL